MPFRLEKINERPDEAIEKARNDTIERAKDVWGLDYADVSDGLYPQGNQIGRGFLRMDQCSNRATVAALRVLGGRWQTATQAGAGITPAALTGWADWLDFVVDEDTFIINEGIFHYGATPTIHEIEFRLSGITIPVSTIDDMYTLEIPRSYWEVPAVVSPKSSMDVNLRSDQVGLTFMEEFGLLGETIAKRSYLIFQNY